MRVEELWFRAGKPRALWRILLFLGAGFALFWVLQAVTWPLIDLGRGRLWQLGFQSVLGGTSLLIASSVFMRWVERRRPSAVGLPLDREAPGDFGKGALIGGTLMAALVGIAAVAGWLAPAADSGSAAEWLLYASALATLLLVAALTEELLFRGYAFQVLVEGAGPVVAVIVSSTLFAGVHMFNPEVSPLAILNIGLAGVLMAVAYLRTRSLWVAWGLHWAWNWVQAVLFDLPVSGLQFDVPGYDVRERGPDLLTGGAFGPEGGLLTTLLSLGFIVWVMRTGWLRESTRMASLRPLVDTRDPR